MSSFYTNGQRNGLTRHKPRCKKCETKQKRERAYELIEEHFGGWTCARCGFSGHPAQFDCHHVSGEKSFEISKQPNYAYNAPAKFKNELEKCELLCANCHRMEHIILGNTTSTNKEQYGKA